MHRAAVLGRLPAPLHRTALRLAHRVRLAWWRMTGRKVRGCNAIVRNPAGEVLLVRHSYQASERWMLPGGGLRRGEDPAAAAVREALEETGCRIAGAQFFAIDEDRVAGCRNLVHLVAATTPDPPRADGREIVEARFFAVDGLPATTSSRARARIELWQAWREDRPAG